MLSAKTRLRDRFEIIEIINEGGMSVVYLAVDLLFGALVAVKELKDYFVSSDDQESATRQFLQEAQILAALEHPSLPRVIDYFEDAGHRYLVMEYIEGRTLGRVLRESGQPFSEDHVLDIGIEIASILAYLHSRKPPVIFRDLKPSNIMLRDGEGDLKLIDFGISKREDAAFGTHTIVKGSGTPGYAPPEQYTSEGPGTDARSDIYALGATLYTLATMETPPQATDRWMNNVPLVPPLSYNEGISPALDHAIVKMMELKPHRRYESAREVVEVLSAIKAGDTAAPEVPSDVSHPSLELKFVSSLGLELMRVGNFGGARKYYEDLVQERPSLAEGWLGLGFAFLAEGNVQRAAWHMRKGIEMDPAFPLSMLAAQASLRIDPRQLFLAAQELQQHGSQATQRCAGFLLQLCRAASSSSDPSLEMQAGTLQRKVVRELRPARSRRRRGVPTLLKVAVVLMLIVFLGILGFLVYLKASGRAPAQGSLGGGESVAFISTGAGLATRADRPREG